MNLRDRSFVLAAGLLLLAGTLSGCTVQGSGMDSVIRIGFPSSPPSPPPAAAPSNPGAVPLQSATAPPPRPAADFDGRRVAVLPLRAEVDLVGLSISDMFVTEVFKTGRFVLVERSQLSKVLGESEIALAGLTDAKAAEVGGVAGADAVLVGTVPEYGTVANKGKVLAVVGISCRLIDCKSGKVVWTESRSRKATSPDIIPSQLARDVVAELCAGLATPAAAGSPAAGPQPVPASPPAGRGGGGIRLRGMHIGS